MPIKLDETIRDAAIEWLTKFEELDSYAKLEASFQKLHTLLVESESCPCPSCFIRDAVVLESLVTFERMAAELPESCEAPVLSIFRQFIESTLTHVACAANIAPDVLVAVPKSDVKKLLERYGYVMPGEARTEEMN